MQRNILILGYYNRKNFGDDIFEYVFNNYFQKEWPGLNYTFITIDDLKEIPENTSAVIFGGGDLVNDYFYKKIKPFIYNKTCPWYAISIGIPYPQLVNNGYLDRFDYIVHRNYTDYDKLKEIYTNRSDCYPDISYMMRPNNLIKHKTNKTNRIGICLSRSIYNASDPYVYNGIVGNISKFLDNITNQNKKYWNGCRWIKVPKYELYFVPFCTDNKDNHDDRLINKDIYDRIGHKDNVYLMDKISPEEVISLFSTFKLTICTRFHAHMFSLMTNTPILSIYTTRKVENLIEEIGSEEYACKMKTHPTKYYPIDLDYNDLKTKFDKLVTNYNDYQIKLDRLNKIYSLKTKQFITRLNNLLFYLPRYVLYDEIGQLAKKIAYSIATKLNSMIYPPNTVNELVMAQSNKLVGLVDDDVKDITEELVHENGAIAKYFSDEKISEMISYDLTKNRFSKYLYGLQNQVLTGEYNLYESCKWILSDNNFYYNDKLDNIKYHRIDRKLNMEYINNNLFKGYHRSGWNYVVGEMEELHNPDGVIFDSYLDKTFGWEYDFLSKNQVLPYNKPWIGVFHHTPNEDYTDNNLSVVLEKDNFKYSLEHCKGIITLSKSNKSWLENKLDIPVLELTHPTEFVNSYFDIDKYKLGAKKVIQIGAWLRDSYAIYDLDVPEGYYKFALKGRGMNNYFVSDADIDTVDRTIRNVGKSEPRGSACLIPNKETNKYIVGLLDVIKTNHQSVIVLENINNKQYDDLLAESVVFIKLVDAAAVNTILECIVRNTPILVNRLPATEQYLGCDYPLFYDSLDHANDLLSDFSNIVKAHRYLVSMNKIKFTVDYFIKSLICSELYQKL